VLGGLLNVLSPCVLPILPILMGRSLQSHHYGPVALVTGLITGFALAGSLLGITSGWLTNLANLFRSGAIILLLCLGILAIFPNWSYRLFSYIPLSRLGIKTVRVGLLGEFCLGTQLGLLWTPCAGPILGSILVLAAVNHQILGAFILLIAYGVGASLPLLAIAYGGRKISQKMLNLRSRSAKLQRVSGVIIVATALTILLGWDVQVQIWLAPLFPRLPL
jgi:cytochrome c biogenesis protein CcdA